MLHKSVGLWAGGMRDDMMRRLIGGLGICALMLLLAGCTSLPAAAPTPAEVETPTAAQCGVDCSDGFIVVDVNSAVVSALTRERIDGLAGKFESRRPAADLRIAVGDTLQIAIIETGGGLFGQTSAPQSATSTSIANQSLSAAATPLQSVTVPRDGYINVPYAGRILAAGRTPDQVRADIERALSDKAIKPQAEVSVASNGAASANSATVAGEVNKAAVYPLALSGSRLLDMIAEAGSARFPAYEINVRLTRGRRTAVASLQNIVDNPAENIFVYPNDTIYLSHDPRTFTVLGSSTKVGRYSFGTERMNLAEAVGEAGGLVDNAADPGGVFLFRYEPRRVVCEMRPELSDKLPERVPVVYRLNLRGGEGYFLAQSFAMRDKDVILVANADGAQLLKFFTLLRGATDVIYDVSVSGASISGASLNSAGKGAQ